ncbi:MAG TPA: DUF302 domain-containing protein [Syntrophorhabdaceae bacterium]|nr:DUF302 domain-containing protein [Syntrophorhabdaceae bacterium]
MIDYGFTKQLNISFDEAVATTIYALNKEGFSVLTSIDMKQKFKEKLGIDFPRYVIFGACNPEFAHKAVLAEENVGLMLPCNIVVYEKNENVILSIIRPTVAMHAISNKELGDVAEIVEAKLKTVFDSI